MKLKQEFFHSSIFQCNNKGNFCLNRVGSLSLINYVLNMEGIFIIPSIIADLFILCGFIFPLPLEMFCFNFAYGYTAGGC